VESGRRRSLEKRNTPHPCYVGFLIHVMAQRRRHSENPETENAFATGKTGEDL
jgi:hypothetical protein